MNRRTIATRARASTAVLLATTVLATTSITAKSAHAQEPPPQVQVQTQPAASGPPQQYPPLSYAPREDGPRVITGWREGEPIPRGYHPVQRTRRGAVIGGAVTFGTLYLLSALVAAVWTDAANATHSSNPSTALFLPAIGPFLMIAQSSTATGDLFLVLDGAGQTAGLALLIWGLTSPQTVLMKDGYARPRLMPQPMLLGKNGGGFGLSGTF